MFPARSKERKTARGERKGDAQPNAHLKRKGATLAAASRESSLGKRSPPRVAPTYYVRKDAKF